MNEPDEISYELDESMHHLKEVKKIEETNKHNTATVKINGLRNEFITDTGYSIPILPVDKRIVKTNQNTKTNKPASKLQQKRGKYPGKKSGGH